MKTTTFLRILSSLLASLMGLLLISCNRQDAQPLNRLDQEPAISADILTEVEAVNEAQSIYNVLFSESLRGVGVPEVLSVQKTSPLRTSGESESNTGSGALSANVPRIFRAYGYQSSDLCDYNFETIKSEIFAQRPVYTRANCFKHVTTTPRFLFWGRKTVVSYSSGHAWVLDGIKGLRRKVTTINRFTNEVVDVSYQTKELVHCNFGWGGSDNGYYLSKAFNTVKGPEMESSAEGDETYGQDYNFQFNHKIIKDIKRL